MGLCAHLHAVQEDAVGQPHAVADLAQRADGHVGPDFAAAPHLRVAGATGVRVVGAGCGEAFLPSAASVINYAFSSETRAGSDGAAGTWMRVKPSYAF